LIRINANFQGPPHGPALLRNVSARRMEVAAPSWQRLGPVDEHRLLGNAPHESDQVGFGAALAAADAGALGFHNVGF
jgi:hypothetical protein